MGCMTTQRTSTRRPQSAPGVSAYGNEGNAWRLEAERRVDGKRNRVVRMFHGTFAEAHLARATMLVEMEGTPTRGQDLSFLHLLTLKADSRISASWAKNCRSLIRVHVAPDPIAMVTLDRVDHKTLDAFYMRRRDAGASETQLTNLHGLIAAAYTFAIERELADHNPARKVAQKPESYRPNTESPTPTELVTFIDAVGAETQTGVFLRLAAITGARLSEVLAIRWADVDLPSEQVVISGALADHGNGNYVRKETKTKKVRRIAVDAATTHLLRRYHAAQRQTALALGVNLNRSAYLFARSPDGLVAAGANTYESRFARLRKATGLDHVRLGAVRHYAATEMLAGGIDVKTAADRLGHDPVMLLRNYAHVIPARDQAAADLLGSLLDHRDRRGA